MSASLVWGLAISLIPAPAAATPWQPPPTPPASLLARAGDRSVVLHSGSRSVSAITIAAGNRQLA